MDEGEKINVQMESVESTIQDLVQMQEKHGDVPNWS